MPVDRLDIENFLYKTTFEANVLFDDYPLADRSDGFYIALEILSQSILKNRKTPINSKNDDVISSKSDELHTYIGSIIKKFRSSQRSSEIKTGRASKDIGISQNNKPASVQLSLDILTRILILSDNICSHSELNNELLKLNIKVAPKILSARLTEWTKTKEYFVRIKDLKSAYTINLSALDGTYGLRAAVPDISNEMWEEFIASVPPALLKKK